MPNNSIQADLNITTTSAQRSLRAAARAMEEVVKAGQDVTAQQRMAANQIAQNATKIVTENRKAAESYSKITQAAIESTAKIKNLDVNNANARKISRDNAASARQQKQELTEAKVAEIELLSIEKQREVQSRAILNSSRAQTEQIRQQTLAAESSAKIQSIQLRNQIALRDAQNFGSGNLGFTGLRYALGDISQGFTLVGAAAIAASGAVLATGVSWQRSFADVQRTLDDSSRNSVIAIKDVRDQLLQIVKTTPVDWEEITKTATLGNQLGIARQSLGNFTQTVIEFSAVTGVSVDDAATAFGRFNTLLKDVAAGDPATKFTKLGDEIAKVGVTSAATEAQIIKVATQISSVATTAQLSSTEVIGLSGALASIAVPPELSRSVLTRVFGDIGRAVGEGGASLAQFAKISGMTSEQFKAAWQSGQGGEVFLKFTQGIAAQGSNAEAAIRSLGITSVRDVPTLIRLANASDSAGKAGGLLAESFKNAANASGELESQYGVIADTVDSKLKVAYNNVQAVFDKLAQSDLGFIGDALDGAVSALEEFGKSLDKNVKLFGGIELPFTNAEFYGTAALLTGIAGAFSLLFGVVGRGAQNMLAIQQIIGTIRAHFRSAAPDINVATASIGAFNTKTRDSEPALRAAQLNLGGPFAGAMNTVNAAFNDGVQGAAKYTDAYGRLGGAANRVQNEFHYITTAIGNFAGEGTRVGAVIDGISSKAASGARAVGGFLKAFGPDLAIAGLAALTAVVSNLDSEARKMGTSTNDMVVAINKASDAASILSNTKINTSGALSATGLIGADTEAVIKNTDDLREAIKVTSQFGNNFLGDVSNKFLDVGRTAAGTSITFDAAIQTYDKLDDAYKQLFNAGDTQAALANLNKLMGGLDQADFSEVIGHMEQTKSALGDILTGLNVDNTDANMQKLINGTLPEFNNQLDTTIGTLGGTSQAFAEVDADLQATVQTMTQSIGSIVDFSGAWSDAVTKANDKAKKSWDETEDKVGEFVEVTSVSLDDYLAELQGQLTAQADFNTNLAAVVARGGPEIAAAAAQLPAQLLSELVGASDEQFGQWKDAVGSQSADALSTISTNIASLTPEVVAKLGTLGTDARASFMTQLTSGTISIDQLLKDFGLDNVTVDLGIQINDEQRDAAQKEFASIAESRGVPFGPTVVPEAENKVQAALTALAIARATPYNPETQESARAAVQAALDALASAQAVPYNPFIAPNSVNSDLDWYARDRSAHINVSTTYAYDSGSAGGIPRGYTGGSGADIRSGANMQGIPHYATGRIPGPAQANQRTDNFLAMLRSREWVVPEKSADFYGRDIMSGIVNRTLDLNGMSRTIYVNQGGSRSGGGNNGPQLVELVASDKALLGQRSGGMVRAIVAPTDVQAAVGTQSTNAFRKGAR